MIGITLSCLLFRYKFLSAVSRASVSISSCSISQNGSSIRSDRSDLSLPREVNAPRGFQELLSEKFSSVREVVEQMWSRFCSLSCMFQNERTFWKHHSISNKQSNMKSLNSVPWVTEIPWSDQIAEACRCSYRVAEKGLLKWIVVLNNVLCMEFRQAPAKKHFNDSIYWVNSPDVPGDTSMQFWGSG